MTEQKVIKTETERINIIRKVAKLSQKQGELYQEIADFTIKKMEESSKLSQVIITEMKKLSLDIAKELKALEYIG